MSWGTSKSQMRFGVTVLKLQYGRVVTNMSLSGPVKCHGLFIRIREKDRELDHWGLASRLTVGGK